MIFRIALRSVYIRSLAGANKLSVDPSTVPLYTVSANSGVTTGTQGERGISGSRYIQHVPLD